MKNTKIIKPMPPTANKISKAILMAQVIMRLLIIWYIIKPPSVFNMSHSYKLARDAYEIQNLFFDKLE